MKDLKDLRINRMIAVAAAGTGKTRLLAGVALWSSTALAYHLEEPYSSIIISGSDDQSRYLYEYCRDAIIQNKVLSSLVRGEPLRSSTSFKDGSVIRALPNSLKSIQGKHAALCIDDEAAIVGDYTLQDSFRIVGPFPINRLIWSGTPTEYNSYYVDVWEDKENYPDLDPEKPRVNSWKRYAWSAKDCPMITPQMIEEAKKLPPEKFAIFWEGVPYPLTNTVIPIQMIKKQSQGVQKYKFNPINGYVTFGIDWGFRAPSVLLIGQFMGDEFIVLECIRWQKQRYDDVIKWILEYYATYKPIRVLCDLNPKGESERLLEKPIPAQAINMNVEKSLLQKSMRDLFVTSKIYIPEEFVDLVYELRRYQWDTREGDDHTTALMLACKPLEELSSGSSGVSIAKGRMRSRY